MAKFVYCNKCPKLYMKLRPLYKNPFDFIEEISKIKSLFEKECGYKYEDIHTLLNNSYDLKFKLNSFIADTSKLIIPSTILPYSNCISIIKLSVPPIFSKNEMIEILTTMKQKSLESLKLFSQKEIKLIEDITIKRLYKFINHHNNDKQIKDIIDKIKAYNDF